MKRLIYILSYVIGLSSPTVTADLIASEGVEGFNAVVKPFVMKYCADCHDGDVQEAKFRVDDIDPNIGDGQDIVRWTKVLEMVEIKNMPPEDEAQPSRVERRMIVEWITKELDKIGQGPDRSSYVNPQYGNRVNHEDLFSGEFTGPSYTRSRAWRMSSRGYDKLTWRMNVDGRQRIMPFEEISAKEIKDCANGVADLGSIQTLYSTSEMFADRLIFGQKYRKQVLKKGVTKEEAKAAGNKNIGYAYEEARRSLRDVEFRHGSAVFQPFATKDTEATEAEMQEVLQTAFALLLQRSPTPEETERYVELMKNNIKLVGNEGALKSVLICLMMSTEFVFRLELGLGEELADGRRLLSPRETAYALAFALTDRPPSQELMGALNSGKLKTKSDVEREVRRMLSADPGDHYWSWLSAGGDGVPRIRSGNPRILRFFQEFFGYAQAVDVFKDNVHLSGRAYDPRKLQIEADVLVLDALAKDKNVFETMLTTDQYAVALTQKMRVSPDYPGRRPGSIIEKDRAKHIKGAQRQLSVYGLETEEWVNSPGRFTTMPEGQRAGILAHPAWLASFSSNFENDPVRRGKWVREKMLAGMVPNVPIGVDANVPEDHTKTLRERYSVTKSEYCWRCHKKMNPLGNVFEAYDDVGMYRTEEQLGTAEAFAEVVAKYEKDNGRRKRDKIGELVPDPDFPKRPTKPVAISGAIDGTVDKALHGEVKDPVELVHKLAKSPLVRQSILRHAFRYFLGRNETLDDSPTLIAMDKAYVESGGSFNETLVALLTSDSFLYRK